jgi:small subunit ribosomal protein S6
MAYEIKTKVWFYHLFEFKVAGEVLIAFETEFRRDERIMRFLTVSLDKHAISWAEEEEQTNLKSLIIMATLQQSASGKKTEILDILLL